MRKIFLRASALFASIVLGLSLVACGGGKKGGSEEYKAEFRVRGPSEIVLSEGYEKTKTASFKFDGVGYSDFVSVSLDDNLGGKLAWDDNAQKLEVREGLVKGEYSTVLSATLVTMDGDKTVDFPFTAKVVLPTIPSGSPQITGEEFNKVSPGYAAFSTKRFSLYGTGVRVEVSEVKKDGAIFETNAFVWDGEERKLNVGAGLDVGVYTVTLTAKSTDTAYEDYPFIYSFIVQERVAPVVNGPDRLTIGEGYSSGTLGGFLLLGTDVTPSVTTTKGDKIYNLVSYDEENDNLVFAPGLEAGEYTVTITLGNGAEQATHDLKLTVKQGNSVAGSYRYISESEATANDTVTGEAKDLEKNFYYPVHAAGGEFSVTLIEGEYELSLQSEYFQETKKSLSVGDAAISGEGMTFAVPLLSGTPTYTDEGFLLVTDNKQFYQMKGATASGDFVVSYTMRVDGYSSNSYMTGGFCFKIDSTWYTLMVYPNIRATGDVKTRVWLTQGPNNTFVNGGYAVMDKVFSNIKATIDVEIAFYGGVFYVCIGEHGVEGDDYAVRIGPELVREFTCTSSCKTLYFPNEANFNYCKEGAVTNGQTYAKIDTEKFFGTYDRVLGFRSVDAATEFTAVKYKMGSVAARAAVDGMSAHKQTCAHSAAWGNV